MSKEFKMGFIEEVEPLKLTTIPKKYQKLIEATENRWFNKMQKLAKICQKRIDDLEHRLSNCIEPKFNLNSIVCYVSKKTGVVITHCTIDKIKIVGIKERFFTNLKFQYKLTYNKRYFDEDELFATEEEAKSKLEEIQNANN